MSKRCWLLPLGGLFLWTAVAAADPVIIDFEDFDLGGGVYFDLPELMIYYHPGGIQTTIQGHEDIRIYDLMRFGGADPGSNGQVFIDLDWGIDSNPEGTDISFNQPMSSFSLQAGDFGDDDDSPLTIVAYDEFGSEIGSATAPWPSDAEPPFVTLAIVAPGIRHIHWQSGGAHPNSVFIDNLTFDPAPPTAAAATSWGRLKQLY